MPATESAASSRPRAPWHVSAALARGLRESGAIALAVLALVLCVALVSFDPHDPGFSFTGAGTAVHNRVGPVGAWFADALFWVFGRPAYILPVMLGFAGWRLMRRHNERDPPPSRLTT
ncbi:MAG TPA: DNA translocase FtsK 4TM domain-containing protein, partial [Steroidobacteraceae bacterium]|nr:DNA translocase FtsK 4TM domain-containing protein [Steroidobacteraceae bacterium]